MKCVLIAFAAVLAVATASVGYSAYSVASPLAYSAPYGYPYAYAAPYASAITAYAAAPVAVAPAVASGYVAATRGSLHVAPHPEGPFTSSQHINTLPAPGTF